MRGGKIRPYIVFRFNVQEQSVLESCGGSLAKKLHLNTRTESQYSGRKSSGSASANLTDPRKKGSHDGWCS